MERLFLLKLIKTPEKKYLELLLVVFLVGVVPHADVEDIVVLGEEADQLVEARVFLVESLAVNGLGHQLFLSLVTPLRERLARRTEKKVRN